jgi:hypothetical protein
MYIKMDVCGPIFILPLAKLLLPIEKHKTEQRMPGNR